MRGNVSGNNEYVLNCGRYVLNFASDSILHPAIEGTVKKQWKLHTSFAHKRSHMNGTTLLVVQEIFVNIVIEKGCLHMMLKKKVN